MQDINKINVIQNDTKSKQEKEKNIHIFIDKIFNQKDVENIPILLKQLISEYINIEYISPTVFNKNFLLDMNINEDKIKKFLVLNKIFNNICLIDKIPESFFQKIVIPEKYDNHNELLNFWIIMTSQQINRQTLGFPLCIYYVTKSSLYNTNNKESVLYFLKQPQEMYSALYNRVFTNSLREIVFQKLLIFFKLHQLKLYSQNFIFEESKLYEKQDIYFKIRDLMFQFKINKIITLSPRTILFKNDIIKPEDYINLLQPEEQNVLKKFNKCLNFYYIFFINFEQEFVKFFLDFKSINLSFEHSTLTKNIKPGCLYIYIKEQSSLPCYCIVLERDEMHAEILLIFSSSANLLSNKIEVIKISDIKDQFHSPDFSYQSSKFGYCIGN